ncbi:MAG: hypothetical protein WBW81_11895 [Methylocella sp.]
MTFIFAFFRAIISPSSAQSNHIQWQETSPGLWMAIDEKWRTIRFSAVKFHLGYYELNLVDVRSYRDKNIEKIRAINDNSKFSNELLDSGIEKIFKTWPDQSEIVAVAPAGWSTSLRRIEHSGFLKISGKQLSDFDDRESLSAIVCLNSPLPKFRDYNYQVPAFFKTSDPRQVQSGESCRDAVQAGPRIIEDPNASDDQRGIPQSETHLRPQLRVIFALDNPGRHFPPTSREAARNAYLILTETVHLWDVQEMLMSPDFYGAGSVPQWAVNMAGGGPSGLIMRGEVGKNPITRGNPAGVIGSAFVVTSRRP